MQRWPQLLLRSIDPGLVDGGLTLLTALHDLGRLATACEEGMMLADGRPALVIDRATLAEAAQAPQEFERRTIDSLETRCGIEGGEGNATAQMQTEALPRLR